MSKYPPYPRYTTHAHMVECVDACRGIIDPATTVPELVKVCNEMQVRLHAYAGSRDLAEQARAVLAKTGQT